MRCRLAHLALLLPLAAFVIPDSSVHADPTPGSRKTSATPTPTKTRKKTAIKRLRPRTRTDRQPRVAPPPERTTPSGEPPSPNPLAAHGSKVAGKHVELTPSKLVDHNVALSPDLAMIVPLPTEVPPAIVTKSPVRILYPLSTIAGTDLRVTCEGIFPGAIDITVAASGADGSYSKFDDFGFGATDGMRLSFKFIVDTSDLSTNDLLQIAIHAKGLMAHYYQCTVDQLD